MTAGRSAVKQEELCIRVICMGFEICRVFQLQFSDNRGTREGTVVCFTPDCWKCEPPHLQNIFFISDF